MKINLVDKNEAPAPVNKLQKILEVGAFCTTDSVYILSTHHEHVIRCNLDTGFIAIMLLDDIELNSSRYEPIQQNMRLVIDF